MYVKNNILKLLKGAEMFEETLELLVDFLSKDNGIFLFVEIKDLNFRTHFLYTPDDSLNNKLIVIKASDSINQDFNYHSFNDCLSNVAYDSLFNYFYTYVPNSLYEGFGISNYKRKLVNTAVLVLNILNKNVEFNLEIKNIFNLLQAN